MSSVDETIQTKVPIYSMYGPSNHNPHRDIYYFFQGRLCEPNRNTGSQNLVLTSNGCSMHHLRGVTYVLHRV